MSRRWSLAVSASLGIMFAASASLAQPVAETGAAITGEATCGTADECIQDGIRAETAREGDQAMLDRLTYNSYLQACAFGSGLGCDTAGNLAILGIGTAQSDEVFAQLQQVGCMLDHSYSCGQAAQAAMEAGRKAEAWAFLALEARLTGKRFWEMDHAASVTPRLPDGRIVLPPNEGLAWAPEGVSTALTCAAYWQVMAPNSPEAAGWRAAAHAAFIAWPPLEGEPARTAEEADRWIGDQAVLVDPDASERSVYDRLARSHCFMGRRVLYTQ